MRGGVPPDADLKMEPLDETARDANDASLSNKADDARDDNSVPAQIAESRGDEGALSRPLRGYTGKSNGSNFRGGHLEGPSTLPTEHRQPPSRSSLRTAPWPRQGICGPSAVAASRRTHQKLFRLLPS